MDEVKCTTLKAELDAQPAQEALVSIERFFDGNDDIASIGCNLTQHPGIRVFREILAGLQQRPDVEAVYARIAEVDPGPTHWPFADTVFVVGTISVDTLQQILDPLQADEVGPGEQFSIPSRITREHPAPVLAAWWD